MKDKWFWWFTWPFGVGGLVGYGMLGPGSHPWPGWSDAVAGGAAVLMGIGWGTLLGMRIGESVRDSLSRWAISEQRAYFQEEDEHNQLLDLLRENIAHPQMLHAVVTEHLKTATDLEPDEQESH